MKPPLVSVVIPNYNYTRYLKQTLDSVLAQTYPSVEILVVDDGSTDGSQELLRSYGERLRWYQHDRQGVSVARNRGATESAGDFIAFLDADDFWQPTKLSKQIDLLLADPGLGFVHCGVRKVDAEGKPGEILVDGMDGWVSKELLLFDRPVILASGSTGVVRRTLFTEVGGFDARLSTSADWDFCFRVSNRNRVGFVPEALVYYRFHGNNMHGNIKLMEHDMLLGYQKAFSNSDAKLTSIRRKSYGNVYMVLAGSHFRAGNNFDFLRNALKSIVCSPRNVTRLVGFPVRWWQRHGAGKGPTIKDDC